MRRWYHSLTGVLIFLSMSSWVFAQPPAIGLDLSIEQTASGIGASVTVSNAGDTDILINQGFSATQFYLKLSITDPVGNIIVVGESLGDNHPKGPVPVIYRDGRFIRGVAWETLEVGWQTVSPTSNLLVDYVLSLPGYHCAQCQLSAMEFKTEDPGNVLNYRWQGVLESNTECFYFEGATQVKVLPKRWRQVWQDGRYVAPNVKVFIWPEDGKTIDDYQLEGIQLNDVAANRVFKLYSRLKKKYYLMAFFNKQEAINSLGDVELRQWYPVIVSGRLADGTSFGGAHDVKIVR